MNLINLSPCWSLHDLMQVFCEQIAHIQREKKPASKGLSDPMPQHSWKASVDMQGEVQRIL